MASPKLTAEQVEETAGIYIEVGQSQVQTALKMGMSRSAVQERLRRATELGLLGPVEAKPGFIIKSISSKGPDGSYVKQGREPGEEFVIPVGHLIKGVSALVDPDGRELAKWVKTKQGELDPIYVAERIAAKFVDMPAARPVPVPADTDEDLLTVFPLADFHLGLYAWAPEAGHNWDLATAVARYRDTMIKVAAGTPPSSTAIVLGGGDYLHANTNEFRTQSGNVLDGDGRTDKVIDAAIELAVFQVDLALLNHTKVVVRFLKGNHDEYASIAIVHALAAWYRDDPRVVVDKDPSLFWWFRFGKVLLGGTHGHNIKPAQLPMLMASRVPQEWGDTEFRYGHMFHVHHKTKTVDEIGSVIVETHQSPASQDSWHYGKGYLSGRSMQSITYHRDRGEDGRKIQPL